jgi:hypothetical protein
VVEGAGLGTQPTRRTVANWLRQFTQETLAPLVTLNRDLVTEALRSLSGDPLVTRFCDPRGRGGRNVGQPWAAVKMRALAGLSARGSNSIHPGKAPLPGPLFRSGWH